MRLAERSLIRQVTLTGGGRFFYRFAAMIDSRATVLGVVTLLLLQLGWQDAAYVTSPIDGLVVLQNGQVLQGKITKSGDHYYVALDGGEIRLTRDEVELVCKDLQDGYRRKRARIAPGRIREHIKLADWCLQHELFGEAALEIRQAILLDANHPQIPLLERRLRLAVSKPAKKVAFTASKEEPGLSAEDLDRLVRSMPGETMVTFTQTIQPLLVNHCTASGCHGPQSETDWKLFRMPAGRPPSLRLTQRNLYATLQMIDKKSPQQSPLLVSAGQRHGKAKVAPFGKTHSWKYQQLADWVQRVASHSPELPQPKQSPEDGQTTQADPSPYPAAKPRIRALGVRPLPPKAPNSVAGKASGEADSLGDELAQPKKIQGPQPFLPKDPFDPEIFNRRYFGKSPFRTVSEKSGSQSR